MDKTDRAYMLLSFGPCVTQPAEQLDMAFQMGDPHLISIILKDSSGLNPFKRMKSLSDKSRANKRSILKVVFQWFAKKSLLPSKTGKTYFLAILDTEDVVGGDLPMARFIEKFAKNDDGYHHYRCTLTSLCFDEGRVDILSFLLRKVNIDDDSRNWLFYQFLRCVRSGMDDEGLIKLLKVFVKYGVNIRTLPDINIWGILVKETGRIHGYKKSGLVALLEIALSSGRLDFAKVLIDEYGFDIKDPGSTGIEGGLILASLLRQDKIGMVKMLDFFFSRGLTPNDNSGLLLSEIFLAFTWDARRYLVDYLLSKGMDINIRSSFISRKIKEAMESRVENGFFLQEWLDDLTSKGLKDERSLLFVEEGA